MQKALAKNPLRVADVSAGDRQVARSAFVELKGGNDCEKNDVKTSYADDVVLSADRVLLAVDLHVDRL